MPETITSGSRFFNTPHTTGQHLLQLYGDEKYFLHTLTNYIKEGILQDELVLLIVTASHKEKLGSLLAKEGFAMHNLIKEKKIIVLDAQETLDKFIVDRWPQKELFNATVSAVLDSIGYPTRKLRAFGEMVAILWANNDHAATVQLEELWNQFCSDHPFTLFCAYPRDLFNNNLSSSIQHICRAHSCMLDDDRTDSIMSHTT